MRIMNTCSIAVFFLFILLSFAGGVFAAPQTTCPVMGGSINKEVYADHEGKRVYFCCPACIEQFKKDPETYLAKLKEMGQEPELIKGDEKDGEKEVTDKAEHKEHKNHGDHKK
ncbi:MAG: YHS domain-containing protein [Candidatus Electrothrix sp. AR4]|nr:YHS domain-containing protein [Candidatus Electrothrix sp. AR4]